MRGLLKTLWRPDREENPEKTVIAQAANILQIGEFQLLQLAYRDWYDRELPEEMNDRLFQAYMLYGQVPEWAEEYARRIIRQDEIGLIKANDPAYHRYDRDYITHVPKGVRQFTMACLILASVFVVGLAVGQFAGVEATSVLPPYFERSQLGTPRDQ